MKPSFYLIPPLLLSLLALACSGEGGSGSAGTTADQTSEAEGGVFDLAPENRHVYRPPGVSQKPTAEDWAERWVDHLRRGSKEGLGFAKERLVLMGTAAAPRLVAELEANMSRSSAMGYLVNLCEVMSACGRPQDADVLLRLIDQSPPPVVRTSAFEALAKFSSAENVPAIIERLRFEHEPAPFEAALRAVSHAGGIEALRFLEEQIRAWLAEDPAAVSGEKAFATLLLCEDPQAAVLLRQLEPSLPPFQRVQAYGARIRFGERDLVAALRPYLDAEQYPSAGTRELTLQLLGELGDWESVIAQAESPLMKIQLAVVALLRRPDAVAAEVGKDVLDHFFEQGQDETLRLNALAGLVERGESQRLDPYLRQLQSFPTGRGSGEALRILSRPEFADARVTGILIARWPQTDAEHHVDLLRALAVTGQDSAATFLAAVAEDEEEDVGLRRTAATVLSNFRAEVAVPLLLRFYQASPSPGRASLVIPGLGKHVAQPEADAFLRELAADESASDGVRKVLFELLPLIYRDRGYELLWQLQASSKRPDVRRFLDAILWNYY